MKICHWSCVTAAANHHSYYQCPVQVEFDKIQALLNWLTYSHSLNYIHVYQRLLHSMHRRAINKREIQKPINGSTARKCFVRIAMRTQRQIIKHLKGRISRSPAFSSSSPTPALPLPTLQEWRNLDYQNLFPEHFATHTRWSLGHWRIARSSLALESNRAPATVHRPPSNSD